MKKTPLFLGIAVGAGIGLFATIPEGIGVKIVMMLIGAIAGTAIGGAVGQIGEHKGHRIKHDDDDDAFVGLGVTPADLLHNYWRDKGRLPLTEPPEPEQDDHIFDPDH
ncbi:hypothetical protein LPB67_16370 [Undibacterium sp. Jales W-56]|uniref:hypothetical protein n=1 Tax=Undibacterium sp. Jales W-56 TaxID=2897325 RepID=UPI0021CEA267|nr:hypothetical protein [Undibacterium sp. Jales W-56]MCU6435353.1 hypothetical protein [Undibacterium sp. Jales W-56]